MKSLIIKEYGHGVTEAEYLHCSMAGSYYIPVEEFELIKVGYRIKYEEPYEEEKFSYKTIPFYEVERVTVYYDCDLDDDNLNIENFLEDFKKGKISLDEAAKVVKNGGKISYE